MQTLTTNLLANVSGGASKSTEVATALNNVTSGLKDAISQKNNSSGMDPSMMMMMGLMMSQRSSGPTVVAAAPAAGPAVAGGPIVNISTRIGRRW